MIDGISSGYPKIVIKQSKPHEKSQEKMMKQGKTTLHQLNSQQEQSCL